MFTKHIVDELEELLNKYLVDAREDDENSDK
jgi:hypothetical protein